VTVELPNPVTAVTHVCRVPTADVSRLSAADRKLTMPFVRSSFRNLPFHRNSHLTVMLFLCTLQTNCSNWRCVLFTEGLMNRFIKICPISQPSFPKGSTQTLNQSQSSRLIRSVRERSDMWHAVWRPPTRAASSGVKQPEPEANHHLVLCSWVSRVAPWLCSCGVQWRCCLQLHRCALQLHLNNGRSSLIELYFVLNFELPQSVCRYQ